MRNLKHEILYFWFEETVPQQWFQTEPAFSALVQERFLSVYEQARDGTFSGWASTAEGSLALVILLDQMPRHMFRGTSRAFETDVLALEITKDSLKKGFDQILEPVKRGFLYVPIQHSEFLADQELSRTLYTKMKDENPAGYMYGLRHYDVIARFGRFPNRNALLGRVSTPEELVWLMESDKTGRVF